jgi:hypothetical protein
MTELYICIAYFSRIKILGFCHRNYVLTILQAKLIILLGIITEAIHLNLRKLTFMVPELFISLKDYYIINFIMIYLLSRRLTLLFSFHVKQLCVYGLTGYQ